MPAWMTRYLRSPDAADSAGGTTTETPAGKTGGEAPAPGVDMVTVKRSDYDTLRTQANSATELQKQNAELAKDWKAAERLIKQDPNYDPSALEADTRHVMARAGYTPEQINEHLRGESAPQGREGKKPKVESDDDEVSATDQKLDAVTAQLTKLQQQQGRDEYRRLQQTLDSNVTGLLDNNPELVKLTAGLVKHNTDEDTTPSDVQKYKTTLREELSTEIRRETLERIKVRRQQAGGIFDEGWLQEESVKAAKAVNDRYRRLVGDPSRLGRTPETSAGQDRFVNTKPVEAPAHKKGLTFSEAQSQVQSWAADMLTRSIAEDSTAESRV